MARGDLEADLEQSASWHIKVVRKGSNNGKIYVGVETVEAKGSSPMLIGTDWFRNEYVDCAYYYCSDGDICRGNQVIMSTGTGFGNGDVVGIQIVDRNLTFLRNGKPVGKPLSGLKRWVAAASKSRLCREILQDSKPQAWEGLPGVSLVRPCQAYAPWPPSRWSSP